MIANYEEIDKVGSYVVVVLKGTNGETVEKRKKASDRTWKSQTVAEG